jgi:uncharacterized membrane protein YGL010W
MNQKLRAVGVVAGMLAISISAILLIKLAITYISVEAVPFVIAGLLISACLYFLYCIALAQIRYEDKLKSMVDKK